MQTVPQLNIGLLNDLHYEGSVQALNRLYESIATLNQGGIELLMVLGDLIDSSNPQNARRLLREVSALCNSFQGQIRYIPGNHDLDHLSKAQFYEALGCSSTTPRCRFRQDGAVFICLDGNFSPDGLEYDRGNFDWQAAYVPDDQLVWLESQLDAAEAPIVIFSHQRIDVPGKFSVQNHAAVRDVIRLSGKVQAVFQGHQHADDLRQIDGTTYYTLSAHKDDAGPATVSIGSRGIRLSRDFHPVEMA